MPDAKISELPLATILGDADFAPLVQPSGAGGETRRATIAQLRGAVLEGRGAHVRDYGAKGDGTTDDAPAIQAAIDDLKAKGGGTLSFGARSYRIASPILIEGATIRLQGAGFNEGPSPGQGTWLVIDSTGFTPLRFTGGLARGSAIRDIAVSQSHSASFTPGWAPTPYDFVVRVEDCFGGIDIDNLYLCNVNRGIYCRNSGRLDIRRLRGQVFTAGVEIDECYDVPRLHNIHFWTFWSSDQNVVRWQQANGDAMVFRRSDGVFIDQAFALGYRSMFRFAASAAGVTSKFYIGQAYTDFTKYGVWIEGIGTDGQIANLTTQGEIFEGGGAPLAGSCGLYVTATNTRVQIGNLRIDRVEDNPVRLEGSGNRLDLFALRCVNFNSRANGAAALHLADSGAAAPNAAYLGSPPLLEGAGAGPLVNAGGNGILAMAAPAGRVARPGLMLGSPDTGLFAPSPGILAGAAGGAEVLRATAAGTVTLGGAPGGHALEVATPLATANRLLVSGGATGGAVALAAQGADAHIDLSLAAKGNGLLRVQSGAAIVAPVLVGAAGGNLARLAGAAAGGPVVVGAEAGSADANVGVALVSKGTGALMAAVPDSAAAGGNPRGTNAVDWQNSRSAASHVASGINAVLAGGTGNTVSGNNAALGGGQGNTASAANAACAGGQFNLVSGVFSWCPGGGLGSTRGVFGRGAWGSGNFSTVGDAQAGEHVLRGQGSSATPVRLTSDGTAAGSANTMNLPNNGTYMVQVIAVARQTGGGAGTTGDSKCWRADICLKRGANAAATGVVYSSTPLASGDAATAGWVLAFAADTANGGLAVTGTGEAGKSINWVARVMSVEAVS
ncbi:glycosyl hydrolase family 28-related protein [Siccirubricoccus sp. G192]|uniref:glycosyl hydrolase family 28-related protein n=1 Tax=Siccirubricoccus sp. G192 TaxID=2849651 RepID=UPI001C2C086E|nr:glycosyl hydrolase family 28-related protein [Siccirubricoccus sp. G192]MBV1797492.1 hypothetical protein [Siccirubricoccus sp. G192]